MMSKGVGPPRRASPPFMLYSSWDFATTHLYINENIQMIGVGCTQLIVEYLGTSFMTYPGMLFEAKLPTPEGTRWVVCEMVHSEFPVFGYNGTDHKPVWLHVAKKEMILFRIEKEIGIHTYAVPKAIFQHGLYIPQDEHKHFYPERLYKLRFAPLGTYTNTYDPWPDYYYNSRKMPSIIQILDYTILKDEASREKMAAPNAEEELKFVADGMTWV